MYRDDDDNDDDVHCTYTHYVMATCIKNHKKKIWTKQSKKKKELRCIKDFSFIIPATKQWKWL